MTSAAGHCAASLQKPSSGSSSYESKSATAVAAEAELTKALVRLTSLRDGDAGLIEVVACGKRAVPALREILMTRETSGLYETRRRAVEALAQLQAFSVLEECLETPRIVTDPVELTGEEAVINATARALSRAGDPAVIDLLLRLTRRQPLAGVIDALGELRCVKALPYLVRALAEDFTRPAAEAAIRKLGPSARQMLLDGAFRRVSTDGLESESSRRFRRSAFRLYAEFSPVPRDDWPIIRQLTADADPGVAVAACELCLSGPGKPARDAAVLRLVELLGDVGRMLGGEIEACLVDHFVTAKAIIEEVAKFTELPGDLDTPRARRAHALHRVMSRGSKEARDTPT